MHPCNFSLVAEYSPKVEAFHALLSLLMLHLLLRSSCTQL